MDFPCKLSTKLFPPQVSNDNDPIVYLSPPRSPPRGGFLPVGSSDILITVNQSGIIGSHVWCPSDKHAEQGFAFDVDTTVNNAK